MKSLPSLALVALMAVSIPASVAQAAVSAAVAAQVVPGANLTDIANANPGVSVQELIQVAADKGLTVTQVPATGLTCGLGGAAAGGAALGAGLLVYVIQRSTDGTNGTSGT